MAGNEHRGKLGTLSYEECEALETACLKNRWLAKGIRPHSPNAQQTSQFTFMRADDIQSLREYFRSGSHSIRDGIVYGELAFVQQVDLGDEWLVLRRVFDEEDGEVYWTPFESVSLDKAVTSAARFECAVTALQDGDVYDTAALLGKDAWALKAPRKQRRLS